MRLCFVVRGRVQGVGYRWFVRSAAVAEGLHGHVENLPDGSVRCEAEGEAAALQRFAAALRQGPRLARVDAVQQHAVPVAGDTAFTIR